MIWVIDASVALRWLLQEEEHPHADAVLQTVINNPDYFIIPELFCFEVFAVLCRLHPSPIDAYLEGIFPIIQGRCPCHNRGPYHSRGPPQVMNHSHLWNLLYLHQVMFQQKAQT